MQWIIQLVIRYSTFFSLVLTVLLSLSMITSSPQKQVSTARMLTMTLFYPFQVTFNQVTRINNIFAENTRLKKEVTELNIEIANLKEKAIENERLRGLLNFTSEFSFEFVPVRAVARDPSRGNLSIIVNAGKSSGILQYMPLVGEKGVVGKVVQVMGNLSLVQLIEDPSNRTSVMSRRTRAVSILETENGQDFFMQCRKHEDIVKGDTIVTSGLGGIYPKGLMVGIVDEILPDENQLFKRARIHLAVDFGRLEELFILKLSPQWASFRNELDSIGIVK